MGNVPSDHEDEKRVLKKKSVKAKQLAWDSKSPASSSASRQPIQQHTSQPYNPQHHQYMQHHQNIHHNPQRYPQQHIQYPPHSHQYYQQPQQVQQYHQQQQQAQQYYQQQQQNPQYVAYKSPNQFNPQQQPHALPQFPNRIHQPTDEMIKDFRNQQHHVAQPVAMIPYPMASSSFMYDDRALDSLIERPLPSIELQKNNFNDKIQEYEESYEKEEQEYEKHEKQRRSKFKSYMDKKREKLREEIRKFESQYNPYEILGLEHGDLEISNIRKAYKKMALKYHPDKAGQEYADHFGVITQSYIYLLKKAEDYEKKNISNHSRERDMNHASGTPIVGDLLKKDYSQSYDLASKIAERTQDLTASSVIEKRGRKKPIPVKERNLNEFLTKGNDVDEMDVTGKDFDIQKFNTLFEKYRVEDENQRGYADLLKDGMREEEEEAPVFSQNMNKEIFNAHFDQLKSKRGNRKSEPLLPDAFDSSSKVHCAQIGASGNFSQSGKYTDIKQAFFEDNVLIDPSQVKLRKDYRNLQELESERSRISHTMDPEVKHIYDNYEREREREEQERIRYIQNRDDDLRAHHQMVSKKLQIHGKKVQ